MSGDYIDFSKEKTPKAARTPESSILAAQVAGKLAPQFHSWWIPLSGDFPSEVALPMAP